jgi:hypothetical protein
MKYYRVELPVATSLVVKFDGDAMAFLRAISEASGIKAYSGAIYNAKMYMSFKETEISPDREVPLSELIR